MVQPLIQHLTGKKALTFAGFLVLYEFLTYIANDMIMPGMLAVVRSFDAPQSAVVNSLSAYLLGGASLQLILGPLSDRYGRRPVMITGAILFLCCTFFIAGASSMAQFIVARFFQGMGLCFIGVVGYATIQEMFAEMDAIRLISIMANIPILAPLLGPLLGAIIIHHYSWRLIFIGIGLFSALALWGLWRFMPETVGELKHDGTRIASQSLSYKEVIANFKALITTRQFLLGCIASGILILPCMLWIGLSPILLVAGAKLSIVQYGLWQLPVFMAAMVGNFCLHRLTHRFASRHLLKLGSIVVCLGLILIILLPLLLGSYFLWIMPGLILYFFGIGITGAPLNRLVLFSTTIGKGTASAVMTMMSMLIQIIGIETVNSMDIGHNVLLFAISCAVSGAIYVGLVLCAFVMPDESVS